MKRQTKQAKPRSSEIQAEASQPTPELEKIDFNELVGQLLKDETVHINSIGAGLLGHDQGPVLREMNDARRDFLCFKMEPSGGGLSAEEAAKIVDVDADDYEKLDQTLKRVFSQSAHNLSWNDLLQVYRQMPGVGKKIWQLVKDQAAKELASGNRMAAALEMVERQKGTWKRAQFLAIREGFAAEWQPRGGVENALIDMMAQTFSEYLHWSAEVHKRTTTEMIKIYDSEEERRKATKQGQWLPERVTEYQANEYAMQMMDRFNRLFLRTLRQLRDLRRYSAPVTINNPKQVNIASDGGKQINLTPNDF